MDQVDMITLKSLIIELKDSGMTFQEVADTLEKRYGVIKTRQAISGLYNRAKEALKDDESYQMTICDIINIYAISDSAAQVLNHLQHLGLCVNYRQVLNVISKEKRYTENVQQTIVAKLVEQMDGLVDIREATKTIEYKGINISKKRFDEYFEKACKAFIRQDIMISLSRIYKLTSNKEMVKSIGEKFNIGIKTSDLR